MDNSEIKKKLNHLIERNYDAERGFTTVVENLDNDRFKSLLEHIISERYRFGHDLKAIMKDLNLEPEKGTSIEGDLHRAWMNFRDALSTNSSAAMFDEAIRGELHAEEAYEEVLNETDLETSHSAVLRSHLQSIRKTKCELEALKSEVTT